VAVWKARLWERDFATVHVTCERLVCGGGEVTWISVQLYICHLCIYVSALARNRMPSLSLSHAQRHIQTYDTYKLTRVRAGEHTRTLTHLCPCSLATACHNGAVADTCSTRSVLGIKKSYVCYCMLHCILMLYKSVCKQVRIVYAHCIPYRSLGCYLFTLLSDEPNALQHTAMHCNTLQCTATHCNALQHTAMHCNTLQNPATHCSMLQHTATHCSKLRRTSTLQHTATQCGTLQHTATHCRTLQHIAACCNILQHIAANCDALTHCSTL